MKICQHCGKELEGRWQKKYCSSSCSSIVNNSKRKSDKIRKCLTCESPTKHASNRFCSVDCRWKYTNNLRIESWLSGEWDGGKGTHWISDIVRKYLLEQSNYKCIQCGWGETNEYSGTIPLQIDHINGNSDDHSYGNLRVLCPNCHSLTSTYRSLNRK